MCYQIKWAFELFHGETLDTFVSASILCHPPPPGNILGTLAEPAPECSKADDEVFLEGYLGLGNPREGAKRQVENEDV